MSKAMLSRPKSKDFALRRVMNIARPEHLSEHEDEDRELGRISEDARFFTLRFCASIDSNSEQVRVLLKLPPPVHPDLGIRIYTPRDFGIPEIIGLRNTIHRRKTQLGLEAFQKLYFNLPHNGEKSFALQRNGFKVTEKVERVLDLRKLMCPLRKAGEGSAFSVEVSSQNVAAKDDELLHLNQCFYHAESLNGSWMARQYRTNHDGERTILVVIAKDKQFRTIGFADALLETPNNACVFQRNTFVTKPFRGLGVGTLLKHKLIHEVRQLGSIDWILTHNEVGNEPITRMSIRLGYEDVQAYDKILGEI